MSSQQSVTLFPKQIINNQSNAQTKGVVAPLFSNSAPVKKENGPRPLFSNATVRKRIEVKVEDLAKYSQDNDAIKVALQLILSTHVEKITHKEVLEWGAQIQKNHSELLESIFTIFNSPLIKKTKGHFTVIVECLQKTAPPAKEKNLFGKLMDAITPDDVKMDVALLEMDKHIKELERSQPELYGIKKQLDSLISELNRFNKELEPLIISCSFFGDYQKDDFPYQLFLSRLSSLLSAKGTIATNLQQVKLFNDNVSNFIDSLSNVLLTDIPMWKTNYLTSLTNGGELPSSENILQKLQNNLTN